MSYDLVIYDNTQIVVRTKEPCWKYWVLSIWPVIWAKYYLKGWTRRSSRFISPWRREWSCHPTRRLISCRGKGVSCRHGLVHNGRLDPSPCNGAVPLPSHKYLRNTDVICESFNPTRPRTLCVAAVIVVRLNKENEAENFAFSCGVPWLVPHYGMLLYDVFLCVWGLGS